MSTGKYIFLWSSVPFKRIMSFLTIQEISTMKWNGHLIKTTQPGCGSFSLLIIKNKIIRFTIIFYLCFASTLLLTCILVNYFRNQAFRECIHTWNKWNAVHITAFYYFEVVNLAIFIWSLSATELEKWLDTQYIFAVKYRHRIWQEFTHKIFHDWKENISWVRLFLVLQFHLSRTLLSIYLMCCVVRCPEC